MESRGEADMKYHNNLPLWYEVKKQAIQEYLQDIINKKQPQKNV